MQITLDKSAPAKTGIQRNQVAGVDVDPNNLARDLIGTAVAKIPLAGEFAAQIILNFWPENKPDPWKAIEARARELIGSMIDEAHLKMLLAELTGLKRVIKALAMIEDDAKGARGKLEDVIDFFDERSPQFFDSDNPIATLPLLVEMATLHLTFLKARCDAGTTEGGDPANEKTLANYKKDLRDKIKEYRRQAISAWTKAHEKRMSLITLTQGSNPSWYTVADGLDGRSWTYTAGATGHRLGHGEESRRAHLLNRWELDTTERYLLPAHSWRRLDPIAPIVNWADDQEPIRYWLLNLQEQKFDPQDYVPAALALSPEDGRIEAINVWWDQTIERIEVKYAGKKDVVGKGSAAGVKKEIAVPSGRYVKSVTAGLSDKIVSFRVTFDNDKFVEVNSRFLDGLTAFQKTQVSHQTAEFPDFGVGSFDIADRCCALYVRLLPVSKLKAR